MHGFCTDFARFQNVQRVLFAAKFDKECRNYRVKNHVALIKNNDDSKLPEIETNRRLALLISGPRVRVPGGAPDFERQIVRFDVLFLLLRKRESFMQTELSSILCVRLRPSAGWPQGSPCRRFLLPPAFRFAGAEVLPGSGLARSSPGIPCRRSCGFRGATGKTATKKPSQNRSALPSLFLEGHASRLC